MMIDEVMYGMMPSAKTANCVSAPPENRLRNPRTPPSFGLILQLPRPRSKSMPGTGM